MSNAKRTLHLCEGLLDPLKRVMLAVLHLDPMRRTAATVGPIRALLVQLAVQLPRPPPSRGTRTKKPQTRDAELGASSVPLR
jgi:hypothetical protein